MLQKITIKGFSRGTQGELKELGTVELNVIRHEMTIPVRQGCASAVLVRKTLPTVDFMDQTFVVDEQDNSISLPSDMVMQIPQCPHCHQKIMEGLT